jgi:putative ABC transport system permease protein
MIPLAYNLHSLRVRKATSVATALGIALVVFVLSSSRMLVNGLHASMARTGSSGAAVVTRKGSEAELMSLFDRELAQQVVSNAAIARSAAGEPLAIGELLVVLPLHRAGDAEHIASVPLRGVPANIGSVRTGVKLLEGRPMRHGTDEVMLGSAIARSYQGVALGESFVLNKNRRATVVGVFSDQGSAFESEIWADLNTVQTSFGRPNLVSSVTATLRSEAVFDAFQQQLQSDKVTGQLQCQRQSEYFASQSANLSKFVGAVGGTIVFLLSIAAMIFAMVTMYASVQSRVREIGTLRAIGFARRSIVACFLLEVLLLALVGAAIGALAGVSMSWVSLSISNPKTWSEIVFHMEPSAPILLASLAAGAAMGVLGGLLPALRAASVSPLEALRD